jgi:hypothetical protein
MTRFDPEFTGEQGEPEPLGAEPAGGYTADDLIREPAQGMDTAFGPPDGRTLEPDVPIVAPDPDTEPVEERRVVIRAASEPDNRRWLHAEVGGHDDDGPTEEQVRVPADELRDVPVGGVSYLRRPAAAYSTITAEVNGKIATAGNSGMTEELHAGMVQDLALRNLLGPRLVNERVYAAQTAVDEGDLDERSRALQPFGLSLPGLAEEAARIPTADVVDHFVRKLESHADHLEFGEIPTNWPEAATEHGLTDVNILGKVQRTNELVALSLRHLKAQLGDAWAGLNERHQTWVARSFNLHLSRGQIGLAMPMLNTASEATAELMTNRLSDTMQALRTAQGDQPYQRLYRYATEALTGNALDRFLRQTPLAEFELTPGADRVYIPRPHGVDIFERYPEQAPVPARLITGERIELPFTNIRMRHVANLATALQRETLSYVDSVHHRSLDVTARNALATAISRDRGEAPTPETPPPYRRLALSAGGTLYTVAPRPGEPRSTRYQEDTDNIEPILDNPVTSLRPVGRGYMVIPNRGGSMDDLTFYDEEAVVVSEGGEAVEGTPAYWVAGRPRLVTTRYGDERIVRILPDVSLARYAILPLLFFDIEAEQTIDADRP